jgi:purine-binding chemotaxis protein CheW
MDFLSIRKKARERAQAKEAAHPPAPPAAEAAPPASEAVPGAIWSPEPPLGHQEPAPIPEPRTEPEPGPFVDRRRPRAQESGEAREPQERSTELTPSSDGRFATWRPGSGPPPVEIDPRAWSPPVERRAPEPEPEELEPELEPMPEPSPARHAPPPTRREAPRARPGPADPADPLDLFFYRPDEEAALVPSLGGGGEEAALPAPVILHEFLTFLLGQEEYAVPIEHVREVLKAPAITEVPRAPTHVLGVVTVRGEVVAVIDARGRLGLAGPSAGARIVIVDAGDGPLGLLVDSVASVVRLPAGSIEPCPQGISAAAADCVIGIGRQRDRLFMVLDPAALMPRVRQAKGR